MIESYLQISCDGCGAVESDDVPNTTRKEFRQEMKTYGWRNYSKLDYCKKCRYNGTVAQRHSLFQNKE